MFNFFFNAINFSKISLQLYSSLHLKDFSKIKMHLPYLIFDLLVKRTVKVITACTWYYFLYLYINSVTYSKYFKKTGGRQGTLSPHLFRPAPFAH